MSETEGRYLVTHSDDESAILRDISKGQIYTIIHNPDLSEGDIIDAKLESVPPLDIQWTIETIVHRYSISVDVSANEPGEAANEAAKNLENNELATLSEANGVTHVLTVPEENTESAIHDLADDETIRIQAAKRDADHVIIRGSDGVISIRYQ
ncbi:MAG: DUF5812 family protein [Halobacteriaceae archaeon]